MVRDRRADWIHYKKAFLFQSKQEDIEVLKSMFEWGMYCAVSPISTQYGKHMPILSKIFWMILLVLYSAVSILSKEYTEGFLVYGLLESIWRLSMLVFVGSNVLRSNFTTKNNWFSFFEHLRRMEQVLETMGFQTSQKKSKLWTEMSTITAIFLLWLISHEYNEYSGDVDWYTCCAVTIYIFYGEVLFLYIRIYSRVMRDRYDFIIQKLKKFVEINDKNQTSFKVITTFLKLADKAVAEGSIIFGWPFLFYTIAGIVFILLNFIYLLFEATDWVFIATSMFVTLAYMISLISMVMSCDTLEESVDKIAKTCYELHLRSDDGKIKKKLLQIAKYCQQMKPAFTAAGFFDVNRFVLTVMFSTFINYVVALIQFHMVMQ